MQSTPPDNGGRRTPPTLEGKVKILANQAQQQSLQAYQTAMQFMQEGKFEKARVIFEKLIANGPAELLERGRVYLSVCQSKLKQPARAFESLEEEYDYAISLLNTGDYDEAEDHLDIILRNAPSSDYAHYGLAALKSLTGQTEECLEHLTIAIQSNPRNRIQARTDSDFHNMIDDPRFTELLYPEML